MPTAHKLPSGSWRCQVRVNGQRRSVTADTRTAAELAAGDLIRSASATAPMRGSVHDAVKKYIDDKSAVLSPSTLRAYNSALDTFFSQDHNKTSFDHNKTSFDHNKVSFDYNIGQIKLSALKNTDVQQFVNRLAAGHCPKTVRNIYGLLTASLKYSRPDLHLSVKLPAPRRHEMEIPDNSQIPALLDACSHYPQLQLAVILAATCGLRLSEICALTWSDIDLKGSTLSITKALVRGDDGYTLKQPKSRAGYRTVSIPVSTSVYLSNYSSSLEDPQGPLITVTPRAISAAFENVRDRLGLRCRFHDLRHYYASVLLALGVPNKYAMTMMGHSTEYTLQHVYQHLMDDKQAKFTASVTAHFDALLPPKK